MVIDPCELSPSYVRSIAPYQPGKPISELARELGDGAPVVGDVLEHLGGDDPVEGAVGEGQGQYIRNSAIHDTYSRCVTVHGTNNLRVENNVTFNNVGHCFFLEDAVETGNQFIRNLGAAGIYYNTYAHMANGIWNSGRAEGRGGMDARNLVRLGLDGVQHFGGGVVFFLHHGDELQTVAGFSFWTPVVIPMRFEYAGLFGITTVAFFLAEMGDKTQVATIALAAQYQSFYAVVAGTTLGMMLANGPAVFLGEAIERRISMKLTRTLAAILFLVLGLWQLAEIAGWLG